MKNISLLLLAVFLFSCNKDNIEPNQDSTNTLIIKRIIDVRENDERNYYFDLNGRLDSITDTEALPSYNNILSKYEYSNNDKLISSFHTYGAEEAYAALTYSNDVIINYFFQTYGSESDSALSLTNNTITYLDEQADFSDQDDLNIELIFNSNALEYVTRRKSTLINDSNSTWSLTDYEYDNSFNLIESYETIRFGNDVEYIETYNYDDKKNPIAESMANYNLALYFLDTLNLINLSPNNITSKTNIQNTTFTYEYSYNNDNYPTSAIVINTNTNEITNTLTYIYY